LLGSSAHKLEKAANFHSSHPTSNVGYESLALAITVVHIPSLDAYNCDGRDQMLDLTEEVHLLVDLQASQRT
jgi:hypothetical protein